MPSSPTPGFVSLQQYLDANKGALGNTAQTLADTASQQGDKAKDEANMLGQQAMDASRDAGQAVDPSTLSGYGQALSDARSAQDYAGNLGTYGGVAADAQQTFGAKGAYTAGDNRFDAMLLGSDPTSKAMLGATAQKYGGLTDYLQNHSKWGADVGGNPMGPIGSPPGQGAPNPLHPHGPPVPHPHAGVDADGNPLPTNPGRNNSRNTDAGVWGNASGGFRGYGSF